MRHKKFTEPIVCNRDGDLTKKWYVEFYFLKRRFQIWSGKNFGIKQSGNLIENKKERIIYFQNLATILQKKLKSGWSPIPKSETDQELNAEKLILKAIQFKSYTSKENFKNYQDRGGRFIKFLQSKKLANGPIESITKSTITEFLTPYQSHNKNNYIQIIKAIFSVLNEEEFTTYNPTSKIKKVKTSTKIHKVYDLETTIQIIRYTQRYPYLRMLLLLEYYQFVRPSEILRIKTEHIDFDAKKLIIFQKKGIQEKIRILPLHPEIEKELKKLDLSGEYLYKNRKKEWLRANWNRTKVKLGIQEGYTIYGFKHTGVCALYQATKDIYLVSRLYGIASIQTTQIYLRSLGQDLEYLSNRDLPSVL